MKTTRTKAGLVLQGYFRVERFRGSANEVMAAQLKEPARPSPRPPRPDLLPAQMRSGAAQAKAAGGSRGVWSNAPRPELLPGMGPSRVGGPRRTAQAKSGNGVTTAPIPVGQLRVIGAGRPLEPEIRQTMESFFGADFSGVRVHEGPAAQAVGALAFTLGEELHFAPGLYDPGSRAGVELLGHELAHVVQQRDGRVANPYGQGVAIVQDPSLEAEADAMGRRVAEQLWSRSRVGQPATAQESTLQARIFPGAAAPRSAQASTKTQKKYEKKLQFYTTVWKRIVKYSPNSAALVLKAYGYDENAVIKKLINTAKEGDTIPGHASKKKGAKTNNKTPGLVNAYVARLI